MFCTNCGKELSAQVKFCENCGTAVSVSETKGQRFSNGWKNCATCEYWTGPRSVTASREGVEVASTEVTGECFGYGVRSQRYAYNVCSKYSLWSLIKK